MSNDPKFKAFGQRLRYLRGKKNLTLHDVFIRTGIHKPSLSVLETKFTRGITLAKLLTIANAMKLTDRELVWLLKGRLQEKKRIQKKSNPENTES
jgi:transcriptional regulator with XRE-family HTH domain